MPAKRVRFEMVLVAIEYCAHYPPHVVYPVGIEEAHRPFVLFGRKTAEHQYTCAIGQKGGEGVFFDIKHFIKTEITQLQCQR